MPNDYGHEFADKELKKLESKLTKEYKQAAKEVEKKMKDFLSKFEEKDKKMLAKVQSGEMTAKEYAEWRKGQIMTGKRWEDMRDTLAQDLVNVDKIAAGMINDSLPNAYAENMNFGTYEVESGVNIDTGFTLYDRRTVENLMKKDPQIIPQARIDIPKDELWNRKKLTSAVMQGILQGESIPNIAKRLRSVADMDRNAAIRNARTYTTAAENKGRVDSYERANNMGIPVKQMWMATLDDRTRVEHRHLDGQVREIGEEFETDGYKIRYPGDPSAAPEMIYSCRCTLVADLPKYGKDLERNESKMGNMTYDEWKKAKDKPSKDGSTKQDAEIRAEQEKAKEEIKEEKREVFKLKENDFVPAQSISEAEEYAKNRFTRGGFNLTGKEVSFKGIDVNVANRINQRLNDLYEQFNLPKLSSLESYGKANKRAWNSSPDAPMFTTNFGNFCLNNTLLKNEKTIKKYAKEGDEAFRFVMENIDALSGAKREIAEAYRIAGKSLVGDSVEDMVTHEIGHHLSYIPEINKVLSGIQSDTNWRETAEHLSGYANHSFAEYIAESFNAYCRGESESLQPEMVEVFESLRRK